MIFWYVIFAKTGYEQKTILEIERAWGIVNRI
jgi:hypothetical protein